MTAPALSPAEQEEALRFGIHDPIEDAIDDLEEHWGETPKCWECAATATVRLTKACCKNVYLDCPSHYDALVLSIEGMLTRGIVECCDCGAGFTLPSTVHDLMTVVTL